MKRIKLSRNMNIHCWNGSETKIKFHKLTERKQFNEQEDVRRTVYIYKPNKQTNKPNKHTFHAQLFIKNNKAEQLKIINWKSASVSGSVLSFSRKPTVSWHKRGPAFGPVG